MENKEMTLSECMRLMRKEYEKKNGIVTSDEEALRIANEEIQKVRQEMQNENQNQ